MLDKPIGKLKQFIRELTGSITPVVTIFEKLLKGEKMRIYRSKQQNKNGLNKREKKRQQVMLKGRGCRTHRGLAPTRGKGRTTHGRRG